MGSSENMCLRLSTVLCLLTAVSALYDPATKIARPHVETYWESWEDGLDNFASNLIEVPVGAIGATRGANIVNIAFADPSALDDIDCETSGDCISAGLDIKDPAKLLNGVKTIHEAGGYVKIAIGGEVFDNPGEHINFQDVDKLVNRLVRLVYDYNLDGVDLTTVRDCGAWMECSYAAKQIYLISRLRSMMPNKIISYTFPSTPQSLTYGKVINSSISHLDYLSMSQCSQNGDIRGITDLLDMGVPGYKIVCGVILTRDCGMTNTIAAAELVLAQQYGGVMTWSINSDTYHRGENDAGTCNDYQTGKSDGTYIDTVSYILNHY